MARPALQCSFCGKKQGDVRLVAGPRGVYICNLCVALCNEILAHDAIDPGLPGSAGPQPEPPGTSAKMAVWAPSRI